MVATIAELFFGGRDDRSDCSDHMQTSLECREMDFPWPHVSWLCLASALFTWLVRLDFQPLSVCDFQGRGTRAHETAGNRA